MIDPGKEHGNGHEGPAGPPPNMELWSREGFVGDIGVLIRPHYTPDYLSVEGPHAPHRLAINTLKLDDRSDPHALPTPFATTRGGERLSASGRSAPMPYVVRNVEADELHFIQDGELQFQTDFGFLNAGAGDFVCIPRAVAYRVTPLHTPTLSMIVESPGALKFDTPQPFGMINFDLDVQRAKIEVPSAPGGETTLVLKTLDGVTTFRKPHDPLAVVAHVGGQCPVWKLNLGKIAPATYLPGGGAPSHFLAGGRNKDVLVYTLSSRITARPPIHHNADYDEIIYYFAGPGAWGGVAEPGTFTWVPKGVTHHGPEEDVREGYLSWLLETRGTLRLTPAGLAAAELMETGMYGRHPGSQAKTPVGV